MGTLRFRIYMGALRLGIYVGTRRLRILSGNVRFAPQPMGEPVQFRLFLAFTYRTVKKRPSPSAKLVAKICK